VLRRVKTPQRPGTLALLIKKFEMRFTRNNLSPSFIVSFIVCVCLFGAGAHAHLHAQEGTPQPATASTAGNTPADTARGIELYKAANYQEAIEVLREAVKRRQQDAQAWLHLGIALSRAGENKDARKAFEKAIKLRPEMPEPHIGMAFIFLAAGKLREAEAAAIRAVALDARNAEAHYSLGLVHMRRGAPAKALEEANAALQINPNFAGALLLKKEAAVESYTAAYAERSEKDRKSDQPVPTESADKRAGVVVQARELQYTPAHGC